MVGGFFLAIERTALAELREADLSIHSPEAPARSKGLLSLREQVRLAKHRWIIERDYDELKQEVAIVHYEGRG